MDSKALRDKAKQDERLEQDLRDRALAKEGKDRKEKSLDPAKRRERSDTVWPAPPCGSCDRTCCPCRRLLPMAGAAKPSAGGRRSRWTTTARRTCGQTYAAITVSYCALRSADYL